MARMSMFGPRDPFAIPNPDPNKHYRWIAADARRMSMWLRSYGDIPGYVLEQGSTIDASKKICEQLGLPTSYVETLTGRITFGLNILASIPQEIHILRERERVDEQLERVQAAKDEVHARVEGIPGVKSFEEHPAETADRKKFHTRDEGERPFSGQAGRGDSPLQRSLRAKQ